MEFESYVAGIAAGLIVIFVIGYFVLMKYFPEAVGISGRLAKKIEHQHSGVAKDSNESSISNDSRPDDGRDEEVPKIRS